MKRLLDTGTFLWAIGAPSRRSDYARRLFRARVPLGFMLLSTLGCGGADPLADAEALEPGALAYQRGQNALAEQRFDWARKHFAEALEHDPDRVDALRLAGVAWLRGPSQSLAPAIENLQRYLEHQPGDVEASQHLARCLGQLGEIEEALTVLEAVKPEQDDLEQGDLEGIDLDTSLALQRAALLLEVRPEEALTVALSVPQGDPERFRGLALASEAQEQLAQLEAAQELAEASLRLNPLQERTTYRSSRLLLRLKRAGEATRMVRRYQLLMALQESSEPGAKSATERLRLLPELAQAVDAANPHVVDFRARLLLEAGDPNVARQAVEALKAATGLTAELRVDVASFLQRLGDQSAAERVLRVGLEAEPDHRTLRYQLARLMLRKGDLAAARALAEASLAAEPHLGRHHHLLAQVELAAGRLVAARAALGRALHRAPWKSTWRVELLELLWQADERRAAEALLADAPEPHPALQDFARRVGVEQGAREPS